MGFKAVFPAISQFPSHPVFYTFNHNSYLDIFLLTSVGLSNIRYLLSEKTYVFLPLILSAKTVGTHYIPQKKHRKRRLAFFLKTTAFLQRTGLSMAGSAEGVHKHFRGIAPFNRGVFHMAMEAKLPVVALYINIPEGSNLYKKNKVKGGTLKLEILAEVPTSGWELENLDQHIEDIRDIYVERFNRLNPHNPSK